MASISALGPLAEARYGKLTDQDMARRWTNRWAGDLQHLLQDVDIGMLAPLHQRAGELVARHWTAIQRVARALQERGELSADEIDALL